MNWTKRILCTAIVAALVTAGASAQMSSEVRVDLNLKDADLMTATRMITQRTGIQFVVEPSDKEFKRITLQLIDKPAEDAIRYICMAAGAQFRRDENGVFIIGQPGTAPKEVAPTVKKARVWRRIKVLKADARNIVDTLKYGNPIETGRGLEDIRRFQQQVGALNPTALSQLQPFGTPSIPTLPATPVNPTVSRPLSGGNEAANSIALPGSAEDANLARNFGGQGLGGGQGFGGPGAGQGGLGGGQGGLGGGLGGGLQGGFGGSLLPGNNLIPEGIDFVSYDANDNSLIVQADSEEAIARLQQIVSTFDVAPQQLVVKVEYITTTEQLDRSLGYEFTFQRGSVYAGTRPGSFIRQSDPVFLNYSTGNVSMRLRAALTEGRGKVVQAPILRTLNNQPATLLVQVQTWAFLTVATNNGVGSTISGTQIVAINAFSFLNIAPRINGDGTITMFIQPQITAISGVSRSPDGQEIPNQTSQSLTVVVRVRNGETVVLGGFNDKNESESTNRVPILSDLPIVGQFFRSSRKSRTNSELLVFVTPTIVDEGDTAGATGP